MPLDLVHRVLDVIKQEVKVWHAPAAALVEQVKSVDQFVHQFGDRIDNRKSGFHGRFLYRERWAVPCDLCHRS